MHGKKEVGLPRYSPRLVTPVKTRLPCLQRQNEFTPDRFEIEEQTPLGICALREFCKYSRNRRDSNYLRRLRRSTI